MLIFFLPAILAIGIITSYEDVKQGKIKNKWIMIGLGYALIMNILLLISHEITAAYSVKATINFAISILIAFLLFQYRVWSAGDGKLFIAFASLIPLSIYRNANTYFPSLALLMIIFAISASIISIQVLAGFKKRHISLLGKAVKSAFGMRQLAESAIAIFSISWIINASATILKIDSSIIILAGTAGAYFIIKKYIKNPNKAFIPMTILRLFLDKSIYTASFLQGFLIMIIILRLMLILLREGMEIVGENALIEIINPEKLKPGMILKKQIILDHLNEKEMKLLIKQGNAKKEKNKYYLILKDALTAKDIRLIRQTKQKDISISRTIPFAPFIFLGTIILLLLKGDILIMTKNMI